MPVKFNKYPLVSVIINCYNGETYLSEAIKSILNQTFKNFEVIFWDNQSNDKSSIIYKSFKDKRLKYYYAKKHTSLYEARNLAIQKSKGTFITFLDTDDYWTNQKLNLQIQKFKEKNIGLVYSNYYILNQFTGLKTVAYKKKLPSGIIYRKLLKNYFLAIGSVMIKKNFFKKNFFFNKKFNIIGDFDFFLKISKKNDFESIQEPLFIYRIHKESFSNKNYQLHINELKLWLKKQKLFDKESTFFIKQKINYMQAILSILNKRYIHAFKNILLVYSKIMQLKLLIFLLIPNFFFKKIKINFS